MALVTKRIVDKLIRGGRSILVRLSNESVANTAITVSSPVGAVFRLIMATVKYSAAVSLDVVVTLNSGAGSTYDTELQKITLTAATDVLWIPDEAIMITDDDVIDILAPAGGVGITAAVTIYLEEL